MEDVIKGDARTAPYLRPRRGSSRVSRTARWVSASLLLAATAVAVLWQGGGPVGSVVTVGVLTGLAWLAALPVIPPKRPRGRMAWLWIALGAWSALLIVPLPHGLVATLRPDVAALSDAGHAAVGMPAAAWLRLAIAPGDAALQGALYLLAGAIGLLTGLVLMGENTRGMAREASLAVTALATVSGLAWMAGWLGPVAALLPASLSTLLRNLCFVNPNHQAGLLNAGLALALSRVVAVTSPRKQLMFGLLSAWIALMVVFVQSRGGYLTLVAVLTLTVLALPKASRHLRQDAQDIQLKAIRRVAAVAVVVLVLATLLALPLVENQLELDVHHDEKLRVLTRVGPIALQHWLLGGGAGALPVLAGADGHFGAYRYDFAENLFAERALDGGIPLALAFTAALGLLVWQMFRRARGVTYAFGMLIAVAAVLMANIVDFSMEMAGVLVPMLVVAACLERLLPDPNGNEDAESAAPGGRTRVLIGTGLALVGAGALLAVAVQGATRAAPTQLAGVSAAAVRSLVAEHFSHDHHAFYIAGRKLLEAGDRRGAVRAFDRAVALRPDSKHAHLFRFATLVELGDYPAATRDMRWLLASDHETFERTLQICKGSARGEALLLAAIPELTQLSYKIAEWFERRRPDLVERMAMVLREKYPGRLFGIEAVLGHLYVKHGNLEPARRIATAMLVNADTRDQGWVLEALIQSHSGHPYEAFVLYGDLCERQPDRADLCWGAIETVLAANRPLEALAFLARRRDGMMETAHTAAQYWYGFGVAHLQLGNSEEAAAAARTAHGLRPDDLASSLLLAEALRGAGQHEEARTLLDSMRQLYPKDSNVQRLWRQTEIDLEPMGMAVEASGVQVP